ncbi:Serine/threonine-protein kinase [Entophlyctis luteolus]|nr:Serine/threonine-protein kinase [Entophlyctis luteolus]
MSAPGDGSPSQPLVSAPAGTVTPAHPTTNATPYRVGPNAANLPKDPRAGAVPSGPVQGSMVGGFRIHEEIGRGSFATVFVGVREKSTETGKPMVAAVKSVARDKLNRKLAENLESEIKILRDMHHPNIVALLDIVKTERHIHLIMEFCCLGDLSAYIKKKGNVVPYTSPAISSVSDTYPSNSIRTQASAYGSQGPTSLASPWGGINEVVIRHFLSQLASALETLRSLSLIHRDLKPQNLLLDPPSPSSPDIEIQSAYLNSPSFIIPALPVLKLADFGFARALPQQSLASTLCGSPLYMAPEILRGDRYDAKVDLWSVGTILYEMITGRPPYKAQNHIDLLRKIDRGDGWVKFPGEESNISRPVSGLDDFTQQRRSSVGGGISSSVGTSRQRSAGGLSLGTSAPRVPLGSALSPDVAIGARPISSDLKDLARRLLKRNPVERMAFEEFFLHPAFSSEHLGKAVAKPTTTSAGEQTSIFTEKVAIPESPNNPDLPDPMSTPFPSRSSAPQSRTVQNGSKPSMYHYIPGDISSNSSAPLNTEQIAVGSNTQQRVQPSQPQNLSHQPLTSFDDLEPPFGGYDLDPVKIFGNLLAAPAVHVPQASMTRIASRQASQHQTAGKSGGPEKIPHPIQKGKDTIMEGLDDESSSISSLGSLEISDEEDDLKIAKTEQQKLPSMPANNEIEERSNIQYNYVKHQRNDDMPQNQRMKNSLDDFVVVDADTQPTEVNWLSPVENGLTEAMMDNAPVISEASQSISEQHNLPKRTSLSSFKGSSPPASPFSKRILHESGFKGSKNSEKNGPSPVLGSLGSGGISGGMHDFGGRVFGNLRDSAHNFLEVMGTAGGAGTSGVMFAISQTSNSGVPISHQPQILRHAAVSASPNADASSKTPWPSDITEEANLLAILNLSTLRGHAVHTFADECHRNVVLNAQERQGPFGQTNENSRVDGSVVISSGRPDSVQAEETLSLYLAALRLYQFGLEAARALWTREQSRLARVASSPPFSSGDSAGGSGKGDDSLTLLSVDLDSLNLSVQWMKEKFDDCLERAQEMRGVIGDFEEESVRDGVLAARPVDKMVYERSLEVCRAAAQAEASGLFLSAEIGYTHAVHLLESILYTPPPVTLFQTESNGSVHLDTSFESAMADQDRIVIERFLFSIGKRMSHLRELMTK